MSGTRKEEQKQYEKELILARWYEYQEMGETISHEPMTDWLESWGTDKEKSCPR